MHLTLPLPRNTANGAHGHWAVRHRQKRVYWDTLSTLMYAREIPKPPAEWPAFATVTVTLHVFNRMDHDNAHRRLKWVLDWLRGHGYIAGDREDQIELVVRQQIDRKKPRLEIEIVSR